MLRTRLLAAAAIAAAVPATVSAQADNEVKLYNKGHFSGAKRTLNGPTQLEAPFTMRSVTIPADREWEFCSGATFTGCRSLSQSVPAMVMTVRSARPVAKMLTSGAQIGPVSAGGAGSSLRGIASEYFVLPEQGGNRVEVSPGTSEGTSQRAREFCRARGWRESPYARRQDVSGRYFLADVLCSDSAQ